MDSPPAFPDALIIAIPLALATAGLGLWRGWLSKSGSVAAVIIGAAVFSGSMPLTWGLLFFFFAAGLMSRLARFQAEASLAGQHAARTAGQVLAVGLCPATAAVLFAVTQRTEFVTAGMAALAFAIADTWATDIGMTSPTPPRRLGFGAPVGRGISGGMTGRGTVGALLGAVAITALGWGVWEGMSPDRAWLVIVIGFGGSLLDSILGATVQQRRQCRVCGIMTETREHCGKATERTGGWLSNAGVNAVCSWGAGLVGWLWGG